MGPLRASFRAGLELVWWWAVLTGVWLVTLSSTNFSEMAVSAGCALPCAVAAVVARRTMDIRWSPRLRWVAWLIPLPLAVVADAARVITLPPRRALRRSGWDGKLGESALPSAEPPRISAARRALATIAVGSTPGTFVVDTDPSRHRLIVHQLVDGRPRIERVVSR